MKHILLSVSDQKTMKQIIKYISKAGGTKERLSIAMASSKAEFEMDFDQVIDVRDVTGKIADVRVPSGMMFRNKAIVRYSPTGLSLADIQKYIA